MIYSCKPDSLSNKPTWLGMRSRWWCLRWFILQNGALVIGCQATQIFKVVLCPHKFSMVGLSALAGDRLFFAPLVMLVHLSDAMCLRYHSVFLLPIVLKKWHLSCQDVSDTSVEMPCHVMSCMSCLMLDWMLLSLSDVLRCQKFCPIICELECRLYAT